MICARFPHDGLALLVVKARFGVQLLLPRTLAASASKVDEMAAAAMKATENAVAAELAAQTKAWEVREDLEQAQAIMAKLQAGQGGRSQTHGSTGWLFGWPETLPASLLRTSKYSRLLISLLHHLAVASLRLRQEGLSVVLESSETTLVVSSV